MIEDFLHLPPVSTTPVANNELPVSPRIFEKIRNGPNGILRGLGETDSWKKKTEVKNLVTLSLQQKQKTKFFNDFKNFLLRVLAHYEPQYLIAN